MKQDFYTLGFDSMTGFKASGTISRVFVLNNDKQIAAKSNHN